jgi:hypothetical protein
MYRYSWPDWFPYPKSMVRGFAVLITFLSALNSNLYLLADEEKFTAVFLVILFSQIPFFMMYHWLFGIGLMFSRSTLFFQYKNNFLFALIEGANAFLVTCLILPFMLFFDFLVNPGDLLLDSTEYYYYYYYYRADFRESVTFIVLGLIASYFYHAGNVFWSWLNHHNKRLNQKYYTKKKQEKLSSVNQKRLTASKREIQIKSLERSLRKSDRDNKK